MNSRDEQWWDLQAGELVLGTLDDHERELFDSIRQRDPEFQQRVTWWQEHLLALDLSAPPVPPNENIWNEIHTQLDLPDQEIELGKYDAQQDPHAGSILDQTIELEQVQQAFDRGRTKAQMSDSSPVVQDQPEEIATPGKEQSIDADSESEIDTSSTPASAESVTTLGRPINANIWRDLTLLATAASLILALVAWNGRWESNRHTTTTQELAAIQYDGLSMLQDKQNQTTWVVNTGYEDQNLHVAAVRDSDPGSESSYVLWLINADDTQVSSVGSLPTEQGETRVFVLGNESISLSDAKGFTVSLEPARGSSETEPAKPAGEVLFQGDLLKLKPFE